MLVEEFSGWKREKLALDNTGGLSSSTAALSCRPEETQLNRLFALQEDLVVETKRGKGKQSEIQPNTHKHTHKQIKRHNTHTHTNANTFIQHTCTHTHIRISRQEKRV